MSSVAPSYQIVITSFPPEPPKPDYCADPEKRKSKPYSAKNLSNFLFTDLKFLAAGLMYVVNPTAYLSGATVGLIKPIINKQFHNITPQKINSDADVKDFAKLDSKARISSFSVAFLAPVFFASIMKSQSPLFSAAIVAYMGFDFATDLTERVIRWIQS